ncbi:MAG: 2-amino-4-hydroxy-6-hydroxymethyldihydropteridine diphosphokinase [Flavobacteriales bacterium]|nr:MAG: 2-amino-4-hydroxy-6-hydroxymethyldihydropteridine diphosphokinase [Flavobacteriales bacterium]
MRKLKNTVVLGLGGNTGNRLRYLSIAQKNIGTHLGEIYMCSNVYQTAAWGITDQAEFINQVIAIKTPFSPIQVMQKCLQIEKEMGRTRIEKWGPRTIDIDVLLYNNCILKHPLLILPHPFLHERRFVLKPLAEIMPNKKHPILQLSFLKLLEICEDNLPVEMVFVF